jgi:hypothetical protein
LETIKKYSYIYCESNNSFADQVGRELSVSVKAYGMLGLKVAGAGVGFSRFCEGSLPASALALSIGTAGGAILGGFIGGVNAISVRNQDKLLKTSEQKARVAELLQLAENRVAETAGSRVGFFNRAKDVINKPIEIVVHDHDDGKNLVPGRKTV